MLFSAEKAAPNEFGVRAIRKIIKQVSGVSDSILYFVFINIIPTTNLGVNRECKSGSAGFLTSVEVAKLIDLMVTVALGRLVTALDA